MVAASHSTLRPDHGLKLLEGAGELFPAMIEAIAAARVEVMLETYILEFRGSVIPVVEALEQAAARGVTVRVVVDGVGTGEIPPAWRERWAKAGVRWRIFNPVSGWRVLLPQHWRRMHRKLCVVDGEFAFCGGINLLDDLWDPNHGELEHPRLDFAVRASGPLVGDVHETMTRLWRRLQVAREARQHDVEGALRAVREAARAGAEEGERPSVLTHGAVAALVLRDNFRFRRRIESTYRISIDQARREVVIANAYFVPGMQLQRALLRAVQRGVKVTLLLQGRYEYFMAYHASRSVYDTLLRGGIEIIEYEPSFLHAKVAVMDSPLGTVATVGSSNLDPLSLLLAREANVFVRDDAFGDELRTRLLAAMAGGRGRRVDPEDHRRRPLVNRVLTWAAYALMRVALFVTGKRY
jgi:cardiolipin synthase A/B